MTEPLLAVCHVSKTFGEGAHAVRALDDVSFDVRQGECLAIVGESGSGKSTIANIILGIYPPSSGSISFAGQELPASRSLEHRRALQLVQQNPLSSLNPKRSIGASLKLALDVHDIGPRDQRRQRVRQLLEEVDLSADQARQAPAALSGGQRQRVAIARALACESRVVVLDEPTSALDVLVQARVLKLLADLQQHRDLTYVFITHDLSVVRNIADRIAVFEKGRLVELATTEALFSGPDTDYARNLIGAVPVVSAGEVELRNRMSNANTGEAP